MNVLDPVTSSLGVLRRWFQHQGWKPLPFQEETWKSYLQGNSGLLQVPTGSGKTYAAFLGPLAELMGHPQKGLTVLYVTPLRALSRDVELALKKPIEDLGLDILVESRTGDSSTALKARQRKKPPTVLVTTPESLSVLLSYPEAKDFFKGLRAVILDEWHELLSTKRGVQTELGLARLKTWNSEMRIWALSATIENSEQAARVATQVENAKIIRAEIRREIEIEMVLPDRVDSFPWAGHLGRFMAPQLVEKLDPNVSTLIFTNTRSQAEIWYDEIIKLRPDWIEITGLHHGSIDREVRELIEEGMKNGDLRFTVCTSSLDLGIDFAPVEKVVQIGSPKGIARFVQRAGRSAHRPGELAKVLFVPTHALEILEVNAVRKALVENQVEARLPLTNCLDVLAQHLVTVAMGGGFREDEIFDEIRRTNAFQDLSKDLFDEVLEFVVRGGKTLTAYPQYHKLSKNEEGLYEVSNSFVARLHRLNIGTITASGQVMVAFQKGQKIGLVEESFITKLKPGDIFHFGGRKLEFIRFHAMVAQVRPATSGKATVPSWGGSTMALSSHLGDQLRQSFLNPSFLTEVEKDRAKILLSAQETLSARPREGELLIEYFEGKEGRHLFVFPFEGRHVHEGLAALLATRFARRRAGTFSLSVNDYGLEIVSDEEYPFLDFLSKDLFDPDNFQQDLTSGLNLSELARRRFRGIAQIAGLIFQGYPGQMKSTKQVQVSAHLLFEVFSKYDPNHPLLKQAVDEALKDHLESERLHRALEKIYQQPLRVQKVTRPTPLGFPLIVEHLAARLTNETLLQRVERMKRSWEKVSLSSESP